jgi:uncharacterized membrane protein YkoI
VKSGEERKQGLLTMKRLISGAALLAVLCGSMGAASAQTPAMTTAKTATQTTTATFKGHRLAGRAAISIGKAREIALGARPGDIADQELEKEAGGSGLRYSFDIKAAGHTYEVGVDAKTGKVLENKTEGANPD